MTSPPPSIASVYGPSQINLWDFRGAGVDPTGVHDSTAGVQAAINAAVATNTSATIWVPPGTYALAGPVLTTNNANAQVLLPSLDGMTAGTMSAITIRGLTPARTFGAQGAADPAGTIAQFTSTATSGAMFGIGGPSTTFTPSVPVSAGAQLTGSYFSACGVVVEDIAFVTGQNPKVGALNLGLALWAQVKNCVFVDSNANWARTLPTNAGQVALVMPYQFNNGAALNLIENVWITGQYWGVLTGEHTHIRSLAAGACRVGLEIGTAEHICVVDYYSTSQNYYGVGVAASDPLSTTNRNRAVINMTIEAHSNGNFAGGAVLNDPNNAGSGIINYCFNNNSQYSTSFTKNGGVNWVCTSLSPGGANP